MEIGKVIQKLRREKDLTQEQLANALGVTSAAVSKWETNAAIPDVAMLCPLARMLGISVDELLDFRPALEQSEIDALLEERRQLFEANKPREAAASCEALLREYPNDLRLKCAAAGLYIMYMRALADADLLEEQLAKAIELLEESRFSSDLSLAASARSMLVNVYIMQGELDKALLILDEQPEAALNARIMRANILLRKDELDETEKLYQTALWTAGRDVVLGLTGLHNVAKAREDWAYALECLDTACEVERVLRTEEVGGMTASLLLLRVDVLKKLGRLDEAVKSLSGYVDFTLAIQERLKTEGTRNSSFFGKLNVHVSGMSAEYLGRSMQAVLDSEEFAELKERADFQQLEAKLAKLDEL